MTVIVSIFELNSKSVFDMISRTLKHPHFGADLKEIQNHLDPITNIEDSKDEILVWWVPRHHGMARPQVAVGGKASRYGG
jgi:hypothetical protein